jgi:trans-2,3-dihydro-3-hydroxyanthranilate isomerase
MPRRFVTLDVFTREPLAGNPLAVVLDAEGLDGERMQRIAREFNLSETVFLFAPEDDRHRAKLRIFTPGRELPFAGHPTVGTAVLLALRDNNGTGAVAFGLEETVGVVACVAEVEGEHQGYGRFRVPRLPEVWGEGREVAEAAWALGLDPADIGFDRHLPSRHSAGVPYDLVPVRSLDAVGRAKPNGEAFAKVFGDGNHPTAYVYTRETVGPEHHFHARMFAPSFGMAEDPATGSAVAALVGGLMQFEPMGEGEHSFTIEQGYEMGRPSEIALQLVIRNGALVSAEIGGGAVVVSEGELFW